MYVLLSVFDEKTQVHGPIVMERSASSAVRGFADHIKANRNELIAAHPEDFSLVKVGEFDEESGVITPCAPQLVITARAALRMSGAAPVGELSDLDRAEVSDGVS